jgi:hypothetical protein
MPSDKADDKHKKVMVIYGHDEEANTALFDCLRAMGLKPQEWGQLIQQSQVGSPYIGAVLDEAFKNVQAVVAFFTPDEHVITRASYAAGQDRWRLQARPNVLIEAGMALATHPRETILLVLGNQELPSDLCVPRTSSTSCDQAIFVDQAADASLSSDAVLGEIDRLGQWLQRRCCVQGAVRPVLIVMSLVLAQDLPQMGLVPDQGAIQELAPASTEPSVRRSRSCGASGRCPARSGSRRRPGPRRTRR